MQATSGTLVPAVVDALIAAWRVSLAPQWTVVDGPFGPLLLGDYVITVGVGNSEDSDPFRVEVDSYGMAGRHHEVGTVRCEITAAWGNGSEGKPSRDAVAAALATIDAGLRSAPTLGGVCDAAQLGSQRWVHWQNDADVMVEVSCQFTVEYGGWL